MGIRQGILLGLFVVAGAAVTGKAWGQTDGLVTEHGVYAVRLLGHRIGREEYTLRQVVGRTVLQTDWSASDRGTLRAVRSTWTMGQGWVTSGMTQGRIPAVASEEKSVVVSGGLATVTEAGVSRTMPAKGVAVFGATPAAVQAMVMRYWLAHGRPAELPVMRASEQALPLEIREVGHEAIYVKGRIVRLTRYTVANLMFGKEILWMNESGRLAAMMTFAGGLPQEEILDEYESVTGDLVHSGVRQELLDLASLGRQVRPIVRGSYALAGVRLVDGTGAAAVESATVVVKDGRVVSVGTGAAPRGMRVVRGDGETLLPGLWEMHSHYSGVEFGPALLARGVTTARDCGGELEFLVSVRRAIDREHLLGPHLVLAGLIDAGGALGFGAVDAETPAEGVAAVDLYREQGFEQVKVYTQLSPEVLRAVAAEAHAKGMTVTGHVPAAVTTEEGIADGMDQINHLQYVTRDLTGADGELDLGSEKAKGLLKLLKDRGIVVDPTMSWGEMAGHPREEDVAAFEPGMMAAPFTLAGKFMAMGSADDAEKTRVRLKRNEAVVKALYDAGVTIVGGSDTGLIGYGLDREMELYVAAGLSPTAAIQTVTRNAARAMRMEDRSGTVEVGKDADFVLVRGNPLDDIAAMRRVDRVVKGGVMWDAAALGRTVGFGR